MAASGFFAGSQARTYLTSSVCEAQSDVALAILTRDQKKDGLVSDLIGM